MLPKISVCVFVKDLFSDGIPYSEALRLVKNLPSEMTMIYGLVDPFTKKVRYIGKSNNPWNRIKDHVLTARSKGVVRHGIPSAPNHKDRWILQVINKGSRPLIKIIAIVKKTEWPTAEQSAIECYNNSHPGDLVNIAPGGHGQAPEPKSKKRSEEQRIKVSASLMGHPVSLEARMKLSVAHKGKILSREHRQKISQGNKGRKLSLETRRKISESRIGIEPTFGHLGKKHSEETKRKMSISAKNRWRK